MIANSFPPPPARSVYVVNGSSKRIMTEPVRGTREQQNKALSPNLKSFSWYPWTRLGFKKHSLSFVCPCSVFFPPFGMHFSIPDSDWTHEVRASAYLRLQPSVTNVASALGTRVSLFKDAGARLKTEARVVILLPGMREMPSISSQDESGLDEGIFFSPNSSCLLLLLNHRLIFFFWHMILLCGSAWPWMFKQKWPPPPKSWAPGPQMSINTSGLGHSLSRSQANTSEALVGAFG